MENIEPEGSVRQGHGEGVAGGVIHPGADILIPKKGSKVCDFVTF